jgi:C-3',4' desaturase CrtD
MPYEVVVVGGGIGGLTTAALLAARGVNVCLLERQPVLGGCVARFEKFGYSFESGSGLFALWNPGEIHDRIFAELSGPPPEVMQIDPAYTVRLPDHSEIAVNSDSETFIENLRASFPECAEKAINFYRDAETLGAALLSAINRVPDLPSAGMNEKLCAFFPDLLTAARLRSLANDTTIQHLEGVSQRFRRFVDAQLQTFAQCSADDCAYLYACVVLALRRSGLFEMRGGAAALTESLAASIKKSGGTIRLNTPALRLAYDSDGRAIGVHLLSGETVSASRAVVSNLTVWDTFGKLVGLDRTPAEIRKRLKSLGGWGAYLLFLGVAEAQAQRISARHIIAVTDFQQGQLYDPTEAQLTLSLSPQWDPRGPEGMRAATVHVVTNVEDWFTYHEDESEHERQDQATLESVWSRLHGAIPELGDSVEVIETATPQTFYETTRRKLGMVGGLGQALAVFGPKAFGSRAPISNLFLVGDTVFPGAGVAAVSHSALIVANLITPKGLSSLRKKVL